MECTDECAIKRAIQKEQSPIENDMITEIKEIQSLCVSLVFDSLFFGDVFEELLIHQCFEDTHETLWKRVMENNKCDSEISGKWKELGK